MKKYFPLVILAGFLLLLVLPSITGKIYKQNSIIDVKVPCTYNGTFCALPTICNITIDYPNSSLMVDNSNMTVTGNGRPFYTLTDSTIIGTYEFSSTCCRIDECDDHSDDFEINYRGEEKLGSGEGLSIFISVIVMLVIGIFFFLISLTFEGKTGKIICIGFSGIIFIIAILYSILILQENFGGFNILTEGFSSFWFVIKVISSVVLTFFSLYCILLAFKLWKIKRGLIDSD